MTTEAATAPAADPDDLGAALDRLLADADIWRSRALISAAELDLFTALGRHGPASAALLAQTLGCDAAALARLLAALDEMGYVARHGDAYANRPVAAAFLDRAGPYHIGSWLRLHGADWPAWGELTAILRTGQPPGTGSLFDDPGRLAVLLHAAHERAVLFHVPGAVAAIDPARSRRLIDVGGGAGSYALGLCAANPALSAVLFDLPAAIAVARDIIAADPAAPRIGFLPGDFHRDPLGGPYDLALISNVLHGEPPDAAAALLCRVAAALEPGGRIAVRDNFLDDDGTSAAGGALFALVLMVETRAGRPYRACEVAAMLRAAGCATIERPAPAIMIGTLPG